MNRPARAPRRAPMPLGRAIATSLNAQITHGRTSHRLHEHLHKNTGAGKLAASAGGTAAVFFNKIHRFILRANMGISLREIPIFPIQYSGP